MPLDLETWTRINAILARARIQGLDPAEALEREKLLLTPARYKEVKLEAFNYIIEGLQEWRPAEMLRRKYRSDQSTSPADMQWAILEWIQEIAKTIRNS